jgi:hypothetical protein
MANPRKNSGMTKDEKRGRLTGRNNAMPTHVSDKVFKLFHEAALRRSKKTGLRASKSEVLEEMALAHEDWLKKFE